MTTQWNLDLPKASGVAETAEDSTSFWWKIQALVESSDSIFIKKLSRNDSSWADDQGNQDGVYIPRQIREAGFFPGLTADNPSRPHIFRAELDVLWPQTGEPTTSGIRHYSNKGSETHLTRLPKTLFQGLTPASLLLSGRLTDQISGCHYWAVVLDSASEEAELLETVLNIPAQFHHGLFSPGLVDEATRLRHDETLALIERLQHAIRTGSLDAVLRDYGNLPDPAALALEARTQWLRTHGFESFNPWEMPSPGDAIMEISRDIEYMLYRAYELRRRAAELVALLAGKGDLVTAIVQNFADIDRVFLSASQQRKTRAGRSFEHHISASLSAGNIRFVEQAVTGGRRPDFVMPDLETLHRRDRHLNGALVLAAKTTLRERWKQVSTERLNCQVFLATVDDRVASASIREMAESSICLVVPESLKASSETDYGTQENVISFRDFFNAEINASRPFLIRPHS